MAQIGIVFLLLPLLLSIAAAISQKGGDQFANGVGADTLSQFLGELDKIPMLNIFVDVLSKAESFTVDQTLNISLTVMLQALPEALISGVAVYVSGLIAKKIGITGLNILPAFIGIFLSTLLLKVFTLIKSGLISLVVEIFVVVIILSAFGITSRRLLPGGFSVAKRILMLVIDALLAVLVTAYAAAMSMMGRGLFPSKQRMISTLVVTAGAVVIGAVLDFVVSKAVGADEKSILG